MYCKSYHALQLNPMSGPLRVSLEPQKGSFGSFPFSYCTMQHRLGLDYVYGQFVLWTLVVS